jgi:alkylmercury lyase
MIALDQLHESLLECFPKLNHSEQTVSMEIYRLLSKGSSIGIKELAESVEIPETELRRILENWWDIFYDTGGNIISYRGLSLRPSVHEFRVEGCKLYTWCAWDTLFIPQLIGKSAAVASICPQTKKPIHLEVSPNEISFKQPEDVVVSFLSPDAIRIRENVLSNFCHYVHFFASNEAATIWISQNPGTFILSLDDAKNETQYRDVL